MTDVHTRSNFSANRLSHAYITSAGLADSIAMAAVCAGHGGKKPCMACTNCDKASRRLHPDITFIDKQPDKRDILVDQIRNLKKDVIIIPSESEKKVYIINNADLMTVSAQNAFLQILEEPPHYAVFILITGTPASLLPTVRSRCVEIKSLPDLDPTDQAAREMADGFYEAIYQGGVAVTTLMFKLEKVEKEIEEVAF